MWNKKYLIYLLITNFLTELKIHDELSHYKKDRQHGKADNNEQQSREIGIQYLGKPSNKRQNRPISIIQVMSK